MSTKYILSYILLILAFNLDAQNQFELKVAKEIKDRNIFSIDDAIKELNKNGISVDEAKEIAKSQGVDFNTFLINNFSKENIKSSSAEILPESFKSEIDNQGKLMENENEEKKLERFGSFFFRNSNITETPSLYLATPNDYRLGPGDNLIVNLFGALENTYTIEISREGSVKFDRIPPVYLSGLSIIQAKNRLKFNLSRLYSGLNSSDKLEKVDIDVSLLKARSVVVNIIGNVQAPGTYTISGFSSILNALYIAGGPNEIGTYRNIKILRYGKTVKNIDLYDYFSNGIYPSFYLRDQDIIFVETVKKIVNVESGFKINALFELKDDEKISNLLKYSGGFSTESFKDFIFVESINNLKKVYKQIPESSFNKTVLNDGDILSAKFPTEYIENQVKISGSVLLPGSYSLDNYPTIGSLINGAKGFTRDAIMDKAILFRQNNGVENEIVSINLKSDSDLMIKLKELDNLLISSAINIETKSLVSIRGEVNDPNDYQYKKNMTINDLIILSRGLTEKADLSRIVINRNISQNGNSDLIETIELSIDKNLNTSKNIFLKPNDFIVVGKKLNYKETEFYILKGEIEDEGTFAIQNLNEKISDIFKKIKLNSIADINSIYVERDSLKIPIIVKNNKILNDLQIKNGDVVNIPKINNSISIQGDVLNPIIIPFSNKLNVKKSISQAGGLNSTSDSRKIYVISQNGKGKTVKNFLGIFRIYPKLNKGDRIIVPTKPPKQRASTAEILSITSGIASLVALIRIITN